MSRHATGLPGRSTGPHLRYETRINGTPSDPTHFIRVGERIYLTQQGNPA